MDAETRRAFAELRRRARALTFDDELRRLLGEDADPEVRRLARSRAFRAVVAAGIPESLRPQPKRRRRGLLLIDAGKVLTAAGKSGACVRVGRDGSITVPTAGGAVRFRAGSEAGPTPRRPEAAEAVTVVPVDSGRPCAVGARLG